MGYMKDRVLRDFTREDVRRIADTYHAWQRRQVYADVPSFCKAATLEEVRKHEYVLAPGRYVGAMESEPDGKLFASEMSMFTAQLREQFANSAELEASITEVLAGLGYAL
jgi:type I restriction enzyme M protein